jgi:uncharacterized cupin superfamily protein
MDKQSRNHHFIVNFSTAFLEKLGIGCSDTKAEIYYSRVNKYKTSHTKEHSKLLTSATYMKNPLSQLPTFKTGLGV